MDIFHRLAIIACDGQKCVIRSGEEGQLVELSTGLRDLLPSTQFHLYLPCLNNHFLIVKVGTFNKEKALLVGACLIISKFHEGPWTALVSLYQAYKY